MIDAPAANWSDTYPSVRYIAPFATFLALLVIIPRLPVSPVWAAAIWLLIIGPLCFICWPREISLRPERWLSSVLIGIGVFFLWVAPDVLFPAYRSSPLFSNAVIGHVHSTLSSAALHEPVVLILRTARAVIVVPIVEELFWRAWLMRWLINPQFQEVPLGAYAPLAFWLTAVLFASEHGSYWDVGLLTGIIYNAWMIRSKSVADCVLMHAITNGVLCAYVIATGSWQYWQ